MNKLCCLCNSEMVLQYDNENISRKKFSCENHNNLTIDYYVYNKVTSEFLIEAKIDVDRYIIEYDRHNGKKLSVFDITGFVLLFEDKNYTFTNEEEFICYLKDRLLFL